MLLERMFAHHRRALGFAGIALSLILLHSFAFRLPQSLLDGGAPLPDWPYFFDLLVGLPLLYAVMVRPSWRQWLQASLAIFCAGVLLGAVLIPEPSKHLWHEAVAVRNVLLVALVAVELVLGYRVLRLLSRAVCSREFADDQVESQVAAIFGNGAISRLLAIECRVWYYALVYRRTKTIVLAGDEHFSSHRKDGNQADQLGFIFLIVLELPVAHLLLMTYASPIAAWLVTVLSLYGLLFLIAEYRATALRAISLADNELIIRRGVWGLRRLPLHQLASASSHCGAVKRAADVEIYDANKAPNVVLVLQSGASVPGRFSGEKPLLRIYLGLDESARFLNSLRARMASAGEKPPLS